ncbi:MAG: VOC family protein [Tissierellia bacterium]|nr:VOC family protein [Tissierellia bacterium]
MSVCVVFKEGKCEDALKYYCDVFNLNVPKITRYSSFEDNHYPKDIRNRIYKSTLDILGSTIYLSDSINDDIVDVGNNFYIVIKMNKDKLFDCYRKFEKDSIIKAEPQKIDGKVCTRLIDKFGISWQFMTRN